MNPILEPWTGVQPPVLALLIETVIKGTALLAIAAAIAAALHRSSAAVRHLVWSLGLGAMLVLPVMLTVMPAWKIAVPVTTPAIVAVESAPAPVTAAPGAEAEPRPVQAAPSAKVSDPRPVKREPMIEPAPRGADPAPVLASGAGIGGGTDAPPAAPRWQAIAYATWLGGVVTVLALFLTGHFVLRLTTRQARPLRDRDWQDQALEAADHLRLDQPFALLQSPDATLPVTYGLLRPRVLLPASAGEWPEDRRRSVLLHELAHVRRHDCLTQAVAQLACAVFWFHPLVWWASSRMRIERERACDDLVLGHGTRASAYADHLLEVVRSLRGTRLAALGAVAFARPSQFEGRLLAVLDPRRDRGTVSRRLALPAAALAALALLPIAALELDAVSAAPAAGGFARDSRASEVVVAPGEPRLEERLGWIENVAAESGGSYWMGWQIEPRDDPDDILGDTGGLDFRIFDDESGAFTLEDVLTGRRSSTWPAPREQRRGAVAFLFHARAEGEPRFDRFRFQATHLPAGMSGERLFWAGTIPDDASLRVLSGFLAREKNLGIQRELVHAIAQHRPAEAVVPVLERIIASDQPVPLRAAATHGLGRHRSQRSLERLTELARTDRSSQVRRSAVEALGQFKTPEAMETLMALARESAGDPSLRRQVFDQLGQEIAGEDEEVQGKSSTLHGDVRISSGSAGGTELHVHDLTVGRATRKDHEKAMKKAAAEDHAHADHADAGDDSGPVADVGDGVSEEEEGEAADVDDPVQRQAVESIGRFPEEQALPRLRSIADSHDNVQIRVQAIESIARYGTPSAFAAVQHYAWKGSSSQVRMMAIEFVSRFRNKEGVDVLPWLANVARRHPDEPARRAAVEVVGRFEDPRAAELLEEIVRNSENTDIQVAAVEVMGRRKREGVLPHLQEIALGHPEPEVQRMAVEVIGRREERDVARVLKDMARRHPNPDVQRQAVESLGRFRGEDTMDALGEIARTHPSSEVRRQAVESMGRRDPDRALPILEEILKSKSRTAKR